MFDLVIKGGRIVDPIDGELFGNIGISQNKIVSVSEKELKGAKIIDAKGLTVAPGFIDIHMHEGKLSGDKIEYDILDAMVRMGVTTAIGGNCGIGVPDVIEYTGIINQQGAPCNYAGLVGVGAIRDYIGCKSVYKPATPEELKKIISFIGEQLSKGAIGLSIGLEYVPGMSTTELLQICQHVSQFPDRLVACHYRFDADRSLEALAEMLIIARETGVKFQISHIGSCIAFGYMESGLKMMETASKSGVDIQADVYPYTAFCTYLDSAIFDPGCIERWGTGYDALQIAEGDYCGQFCDEELFLRLRKEGAHVLTNAFVMREDEVKEAIRHPLIMIASDGMLSNGQGHPRTTGTFPRALGKYVREERAIDLAQAINKITNMPAQRLGFTSKGRILEGYDADITIFDADKVIDNSTFENPNLPPAGINYVIVNGKLALEDSKLTGVNSGKGLLRL